MNRDDRLENIFRDDEDRRRFLTTLGEACARTEWQAHAYGLMGNHLPVPSTADRFSPGAGNAPSEPGSRNEIALGVYPKRFNLRLQLCCRLLTGGYNALRVDRWLGESGLPRDTAAGRKEFAQA